MTIKQFTPALTPAEMISLGVFQSSYFTIDTVAEFVAGGIIPHSMIGNIASAPQPSANLFGVKSGQSRAEWNRKKWIHPQDPLGWFQWYCRYSMGRRTTDDERQIHRHVSFTRHLTQIDRYGHGNIEHSPVRRQALVQWSYDPLIDFDWIDHKETVYEKCIRILDKQPQLTSLII